jgi:hypothetical protein
MKSAVRKRLSCFLISKGLRDELRVMVGEMESRIGSIKGS